jgi:hypothetical protein
MLRPRVCDGRIERDDGDDDDVIISPGMDLTQTNEFRVQGSQWTPAATCCEQQPTFRVAHEIVVNQCGHDRCSDRSQSRRTRASLQRGEVPRQTIEQVFLMLLPGLAAVPRGGRK